MAETHLKSCLRLEKPKLRMEQDAFYEKSFNANCMGQDLSRYAFLLLLIMEGDGFTPSFSAEAECWFMIRLVRT